MESPAKSSTDSADVFSLLGLIVGVLLMATIGYFLFSNVGNVRDFIRKTDTYPLAISTTPAGAAVILDGQLIGKSPVTTLTYPGAHALTIRKDGYEPLAKAIELSTDHYRREKDGTYRLVEKGSPWSFNFELQAPTQVAVTPPSGQVHSPETSGKLNDLQKQITDLRSSIVSNPEQALSYGLLKSRVDSIERDATRLREQAEFSNNLLMGIWATMAAIFLTLIALWFSRKESSP